MSFKWKIYEYVNERGDSVIGEWLIEKAISPRDRGQLVQKMDMLATSGPDLPPRLLAGPIASKRIRNFRAIFTNSSFTATKCYVHSYVKGR